MFCNRCGHRNAETAAFCERCAAALEAAPTQRHPVVASPERSLSGDDRYTPPATPWTSPTLVVRRGPNAGSAFALAAGTTTLGRDPDAIIFLSDITVSSRHAVIARDDSGCFLRDEGSLNGTYLNGRLIQSQVPLHHGDELQIGVFKIVYFGRSVDAEPDDLGSRE